MPLHVRPPTRRSFLAVAGGATATLVSTAFGWHRRFDGLDGPAPSDPERWALLSDPHVTARPDGRRGACCMNANCAAAVADVLSLDGTPPAGVIVNGDCAVGRGRTADYRAFRDLVVAPLAAADIPLHLTLGNHDHRGRFLEALGGHLPSRGAATDCAGRVVSVVRARHANFVLLDTLGTTNRMGGKAGDAQLRWLDAALAANADKPALVVAHHPLPGTGLLGRVGAVRDGARLWDVLRRHPHVKAYVYGHTHRWDVARRDGVYLVNLPTTAYVFNARQPTGWVDLHLGRDGAELRLRTIGPRRGEGWAGGASATIAWG